MQNTASVTSAMSPVEVETVALSMRDRILSAATALFKTLPVSKITMEDIAREAGVVRSTVYKSFKNKEELLGALFSLEIRTKHHPVIRKMHEKTISIDMLTDMFVAELELALNYVLLGNTFDPSKIPGIGEIVLSSAEISDSNRSLWVPILRDYQEKGLLKPDLDLEKSVRWLTYQHVWLISHPKALTESKDERRDYIHTFIFGALTQPK